MTWPARVGVWVRPDNGPPPPPPNYELFLSEQGLNVITGAGITEFALNVITGAGITEAAINVIYEP
jgi:hypothetical protein